VVEHLPLVEKEMLKQMDFSCWERMLMAGVRVLVGGATVVPTDVVES